MSAPPAFGDDACAYLRHRPGYPDALYDVLLAACGDRRGLCVDLGAGSGQASLALAERFGRVVAIEPDARMLALMPDHPRIEKRDIAAEDADFPDGTVDAVTVATAFHWMDQPRVIANVHRWLRPGGAFFPFLFGPFEAEGDAAAVVKRHRTRWKPYFDRRLGAAADYSVAMRASGLFPDLAMHKFEVRRDASPADAAALFMTSSYARAYAAEHGGEAAYAAELQADFERAGPVVRLRLPLGGVLAIRR